MMSKKRGWNTHLASVCQFVTYLFHLPNPWFPPYVCREITVSISGIGGWCFVLKILVGDMIYVLQIISMITFCVDIFISFKLCGLVM